MNFLICKCDKDPAKEDISLSNLLDIKNLEKSLKNSEINILKNDILERKSNEKENSTYELEIIEYPYSKNEINNYKNDNNNHNGNQTKTKIKKDNNQIINSLKMNMIKRNEHLFNNKKNIQNKVVCSKGDLNSSLNNESLIVDDEINYLNDDDTQSEKTEKSNTKKSINKKENINSNQKLKMHLLLKTKPKHTVNKLYYFNSYNNTSGRGSYNARTSNESMKSWTTKVSTLNNSNKKYKKIYPNSKINNLSIKKYNKKFLENSLNSSNTQTSQGKKSINKTILHSLNNSVGNKKKFFKNNLSKEIHSNIDKDYNIMNIFNNKRIIKRRVNFKKLK